MTPLKELRREIARLLGDRPSLKRARQEDFLLVLHGPREAAALEEAGYRLIPLGERRWGLEPPAAFYQCPMGPEPAFRPGAAYELYRLLGLHPQGEDRTLVRGLLKAMETGETEKFCVKALGECALRLRKKQPLPGDAREWLGRYLNESL